MIGSYSSTGTGGNLSQYESRRAVGFVVVVVWMTPTQFDWVTSQVATEVASFFVADVCSRPSSLSVGGLPSSCSQFATAELEFLAAGHPWLLDYLQHLQGW